jgi:hypothetical protein
MQPERGAGLTLQYSLSCVYHLLTSDNYDNLKGSASLCFSNGNAYVRRSLAEPTII